MRRIRVNSLKSLKVSHREVDARRPDDAGKESSVPILPRN